MERTKYLIVGGGMTGHAAATALRERDPDGTLTLLSAEADPPYARPPLSKGLWLGKEEASVALPAVAGLRLELGRRAVTLDARLREVRDDRGTAWRYEKLLLATGGRPRRLPFGGDRVVYYRTLADFRRVKAAPGARVVVIGAGFIGSEIAASLAQAGRQVSMVFPDAAIGARVYPPDLAAHVTRTFEQRGVGLYPRDAVAAVHAQGAETVVETASGRRLAADVVVAGLGITADVELAETAGLRTEDGIVVSDRLEASVPGVYAAGDVARFPSPLGEVVRVEHEDAALTMGAAAGRIMAGSDERYDHLPFFYSDLFDMGYEAVGHLDARLETVASWKEPFREGVVAYLDGGQVKGVLCWGLFGHMEAARRLVLAHRPVGRDELMETVLH